MAAATPSVRVADVDYNVNELLRQLAAADEAGADVLVFPELSVTAYTCGDLFLQEQLLRAAKAGLQRMIEASRSFRPLFFVGLPFAVKGKLYNVAAAVQGGRLLALIPKANIPNYTEFYEARYFAEGNAAPFMLETGLLGQAPVPFGTNVLLDLSLEAPARKDATQGKTAQEGNAAAPGVVSASAAMHAPLPVSIAVEICEDLWVGQTPGGRHAEQGAALIVNLSASNETAGKAEFRRQLISMDSAKLLAAYVYAGAGPGESSTDLVFGGQRLIAENGTVLAAGTLYEEGLTLADVDVNRLLAERRRMTTFPSAGVQPDESYVHVPLVLAARPIRQQKNGAEASRLLRFVDPHPFVPSDKAHRAERCREIFAIQAQGLKKRLSHIGCKQVVIGLSGGLDSTLALLVTREAFSLLQLPPENILCVTMPAFGTTDRTYHNACILAQEVGGTLREINISQSVLQHFRDIGHDPAVQNAAYENGQARERTQILMDLANDVNGIVIGTGDLSEMALGWCTYNGDHMSMYAVNADIPKTLVRYLVRYRADSEQNKALQTVLYDVLDTPVSPELLPASADGTISQKTEDLVGPYELHDFFLYHFLRFGSSPRRILQLAEQAFDGVTEPGLFYDRQTILKWLQTFYRRFFSQQFKRSCSVDGPKVGSVDLSPRGGFRMPSDAVVKLWLAELSERMD